MYTHDNYKRVKDEFEAKRNRALAEAEGRCNAVRAASAKIAAIDEELSGTGLALFRAACNGEDIAPIKMRNEQLRKMREDELVALGYPSDYTEPKFSCLLCSDTGSVELKLCGCFKKRLITENIKSSGIGNLIEKQSFDNFDINWYSADAEVYARMQSNLRLAKKYADEFGKEKPKNILMIGKTGVGKTHISTAIAKVVIERGYNVLYDSAQNIISDFEQDRFKSGYGPYEPVSDKYLECDLLIIDDLGTEFINQFTVSCIYNLINTRSNRALPTIISTNLDTEELISKYEGRITSRLLGADAIVLMFGGKDHRVFG